MILPSICQRLLLCLLLSPLASTHALQDDGAPYGALKLGWMEDRGLLAGTQLSLADLDALPQASLTLALPEALGIAGQHTWSGVPLRDLVASSGRQANSLRITALNDYSVTVPASDLRRFDPILAYRRDGQFISVRDKGPFILIYPFNRHAELNQQIYLNRSIWQIDEIALQ